MFDEIKNLNIETCSGSELKALIRQILPVLNQACEKILPNDNTIQTNSCVSSSGKIYADNRGISELLELFLGLRDIMQGVQGRMADIEGILKTFSADHSVPSTDVEMAVFSHSPDFRSVCVKGEHYAFTTAQAACMQLLYKQWKNNTPEISGEYIIETIGCCSKRLSDLFKSHPAWGKLIVSGSTRGTYQLNVPK